MAYYALVTTLNNVHKDPNSDNLWLADCFGEGVIVGSDMYEGEKVLYLPQDGKVERWFGNAFHLFRKNEDGTPQGGYIEDNQHIRAIKLRGNQSSGIVIAYDKLKAVFPVIDWEVGDKVYEINGRVFCSKYIPKRKPGMGVPRKTSYKGRKADEVIYPEFSMHSDTQQLAYNLDDFKPGDKINMTLKLHGTSTRHMKTWAIYPKSWWRKLFHIKPKKILTSVCGTRRCIVTPNSRGYYGNDAFRLEWHKKVDPYLEEGLEVFGELVGWYGPKETDTIMPIADNKKINDKKFVKKFGPQTVFSYGCKPGQCDFYVYRITKDDYEFTPEEITNWCNEHGFKRVPIVENFEFTTIEDLKNRVDKYFEDIVDPIGKTHIKEGVVLRIVNRRTFTAYKTKLWEFRVLEGILKDNSNVPDVEEMEEIIESNM